MVPRLNIILLPPPVTFMQLIIYYFNLQFRSLMHAHEVLRMFQSSKRACFSRRGEVGWGKHRGTMATCPNPRRPHHIGILFNRTIHLSPQPIPHTNPDMKSSLSLSVSPAATLSSGQGRAIAAAQPSSLPSLPLSLHLRSLSSSHHHSFTTGLSSPLDR